MAATMPSRPGAEILLEALRLAEQQLAHMKQQTAAEHEALQRVEAELAQRQQDAEALITYMGDIKSNIGVYETTVAQLDQAIIARQAELERLTQRCAKMRQELELTREELADLIS
jgi:chromosome segregation ATPase